PPPRAPRAWPRAGLVAPELPRRPAEPTPPPRLRADAHERRHAGHGDAVVAAAHGLALAGVLADAARAAVLPVGEGLAGRRRGQPSLPLVAPWRAGDSSARTRSFR